jgi:soluble lytic murein transglycosylase-like protein
MMIAAVTSEGLDEQHQIAVDAGVLTVYAEEVDPTTTTVPVPVPTSAPVQTRKYFDVPLSHDVQDHIFTECEKYDISPAVIVAMIDHESDFDTYNLGDDGRAAGLMQIQAKWHLKRMIKLDCTDLFDPYQNITVGVNYLAELLDKYDGDIAKALVAYNQGSYKGTITNYAKEILNNATEVTIIND